MWNEIQMLPVHENGNTGGTTRAIKHYAEAKKKRMNNFDPSKPPSIIIYFNFNKQNGKKFYQNHYLTVD